MPGIAPDANAPRRAQARRMSGPATLRVTIELTPAVEPIQGVLHADDGPTDQRFCGWVELAAAFEAILARGHTRADDPPPDRGVSA